MDDEQETELRNPFPSPPAHYTRYTTQNVRLLSSLKNRTDAGSSKDVKPQERASTEQLDVPEWDLTQLEKPRVDWILEDGQYEAYGDPWFVKETIASLQELGGHQLYPPDPTVDRRPALSSILRTLLVTYSSLLKSLLAPPPLITSSERPEWQGHIEWITIMGQNIMSAANELRPVQARCNLEAMMKHQLELRREEAAAIHKICDDLEARLAELQAASSTLCAVPASLFQESNLKNVQTVALSNQGETLTMVDVLKWAEGQ